MTTHSAPHSAIIYDFAARGRAILEARGQSVRLVERAQPDLPKVSYGSASYHEAAIEEAARTRKP